MIDSCLWSSFSSVGLLRVLVSNCDNWQPGNPDVKPEMDSFCVPDSILQPRRFFRYGVMRDSER
jgi:hypothetical protein